MAKIGDLKAQLTLDNKDFENKLKKSRKQTQTFTQKAGDGFKGLSKNIGLMKKAMAGLVAVMAIRGVLRALDGAIDRMDRIGKVADTIGMTTDELQELSYAANRAGIDTETLYKAMKKLNEGIGDAVMGKGVLLEIIKKYGIEIRNENGALKTNREMLYEIADVIKRTTNHQEKLNIASKAFGARGSDIIVLLNKGSSALKEYELRARTLGLVIKESLIRSSEEARDKLDDLKDVVGTQITIALGNMAPAIANVGLAFAEALPSIVAFMEELFVDEDKQGITTLELRLNKIQEKIKETQKKLDEQSRYKDGSVVFKVRKENLQEEQNQLKAAELDLVTQILKKEKEQVEATAERKHLEEERSRLSAELFKAEQEATDQRLKSAAAEKQKDADAKAAAQHAAQAADKLANEAERELKALDAKVEAWKKIADPTRVYTQQIEELNAALLSGAITAEVYAGNMKEIAKDLVDLGDTAEDVDNEISIFAEQAARNIQDSFAEFLFDPFGDGTDQMLKNFGDMLKKMAAQAAAQKILSLLFGGLAGSSNSFLSALGNTFASPKAGGGTIQAGQLIPVGERGIEYITTPGPARVLTSQAAHNVSGGSQAMRIEIVNKGTPQQIESATSVSDPKGAVTQIVINDLRRDGPISGALGALYSIRRTA